MRDAHADQAATSARRDVPETTFLHAANAVQHNAAPVSAQGREPRSPTPVSISGDVRVGVPTCTRDVHSPRSCTPKQMAASVTSLRVHRAQVARRQVFLASRPPGGGWASTCQSAERAGARSNSYGQWRGLRDGRALILQCAPSSLLPFARRDSSISPMTFPCQVRRPPLSNLAESGVHRPSAH